MLQSRRDGRSGEVVIANQLSDADRITARIRSIECLNRCDQIWRIDRPHGALAPPGVPKDQGDAERGNADESYRNLTTNFHGITLWAERVRAEGLPANEWDDRSAEQG